MDGFPEAKPLSPFELAAVPFCTRPDRAKLQGDGWRRCRVAGLINNNSALPFVLIWFVF
jgi:hypothetical protein